MDQKELLHSANFNAVEQMFPHLTCIPHTEQGIPSMGQLGGNGNGKEPTVRAVWLPLDIYWLELHLVIARLPQGADLLLSVQVKEVVSTIVDVDNSLLASNIRYNNPV